MKKRNILMATYTLSIYAIVLVAMLSSCTNSHRSGKDKDYKDMRTIVIVDINGDTIRITGGATCHLDKKISR